MYHLSYAGHRVAIDDHLAVMTLADALTLAGTSWILSTNGVNLDRWTNPNDKALAAHLASNFTRRRTDTLAHH